MASQPSANFPGVVSRSSFQRSFADALRIFIGRGKRYSVKQAAVGANLAERVIECAMCDPEGTDYREPPAHVVLSLTSFLGPEFTVEWLSLAKQGAFWLPDIDEPAPGEIAADLADGTSAVVRRALDGEFDANDRHDLRPVGRKLMLVGAQLAQPTGARSAA